MSWQQRERSKIAAACSVDPDLLRAVAVGKVLRRCGAVMRSSHGDANTYELGRQVASIVSFWSHSWHASVTRKIFCLFYHYNGLIAGVASVAVSFAVALLVHMHVIPGLACWNVGCSSHSDCPSEGYCAIVEDHTECRHVILCCIERHESIDGQCPHECPVPISETISPLAYLPLLAGCATYIVLLIFWHHSHCVFLDKVCIHQTDAEKKQRGIDGLGGFLRHSNHMLILWDTTYFTRLWCTYEVAAFRYLHGADACFSVVPIVRGFLILLCLPVTFSMAICLICAKYIPTNAIMINCILSALIFALGVAVARIAREEARNRHCMQQQIQNFSVRNARCYCCDVGHKHPDTGAAMTCDREAVYSAIQTWFEGRLDGFQTFVRNELYSTMEREMGPSLLSYLDALHITLPVLWFYIAELNSMCQSWANFGRRARIVFGGWFTIGPLSVAILVRVAMATVAKDPTRRADWTISVVIALFWGCMRVGLIMLQGWALRYSPYLNICVSVIYGIVAKLLLDGVPNISRPSRGLRNEKEGLDYAKGASMVVEVDGVSSAPCSQIDQDHCVEVDETA